MPFDRLITLRFKRFERDFFNELVEVDPVDNRVWAEQRGAGSSDELTQAGVTVSNVRAYTVRFFQALIDESIATLFVIDEAGNEYNTISVAESDARRRSIEVQVVRST